MKKLLILMLVFGISSIASATLQISADGIMEPEETDIWVFPSEYVILDIWTTTVISADAGGEGYYALAAAVADATISGGAPAQADPGLTIYDDAVGVIGVPLPAGDNGVAGTIIVSLLPQFDAGSVLFDEILFHCEWAINDVLVTLWYSPDFGTWTIEDTIIIHNIPEPATMALLGLGSLFLMRRRRK